MNVRVYGCLCVLVCMPSTTLDRYKAVKYIIRNDSIVATAKALQINFGFCEGRTVFNPRKSEINKLLILNLKILSAFLAENLNTGPHYMIRSLGASVCVCDYDCCGRSFLVTVN